ncbi:MAG TPA: fumarylacetoacetate hydrolase family protein, partial [Chloroflexia bacterium]|nr:fumarylacetoacetate hydrolase family protein [Chloroflexia bacterium]
MRYLTYLLEGQPRLGALHQNYIVDVAKLVGGPDTMLNFIQAGPEHWQKTASVFANVDAVNLSSEGIAIPYDDSLLLAPIPRPLKNVFCLGRNYYKHYLEGAVSRGEQEDKPPAAPIWFTKPPTAVNGPFDSIELDPEVTAQLDW